ncbi:hypothetical protein DVH24_042369 [Malus domestica]|uniref:Uncharacterized protein n=1 Tax=Malus domestica TaxID=3750 RepID=A0A498IY99_MALDO|nr:hypothetical protein DVH24_042369 [Malus domestica]
METTVEERDHLDLVGTSRGGLDHLEEIHRIDGSGGKRTTYIDWNFTGHPNKALEFVTWGEMEAMTSCHFLLTPLSDSMFLFAAENGEAPVFCTLLPPLL